jgi:hypothetical protein
MRKGFKKVYLANLQGILVSLWRFLSLGCHVPSIYKPCPSVNFLHILSKKRDLSYNRGLEAKSRKKAGFERFVTENGKQISANI